MGIFEDTNTRELQELLAQIHKGEAALPDFQRDFVWDPSATQELIVSIASDYPAGSLLRLRNTRGLFAAREFEGAPPLASRRATYLVLDGQQRLTSLYQAFYGVGDYRYYLNLRRLLAGDEFGECLFHLRATHKRALEYGDLDAQARDLVMPLSLLRDGVSQFSRWSRKIAKLVPPGELDGLDDSLSDIQEKWIETIDDYRFPVVTLSEKTPLDAVCTIFEAVNRISARLSPFELLTARLRPGAVNLRVLWAQAQEQHPVIAAFDIDPYAMLQAIALVGYDPPTCQRRDILNLDAGDIEYWWPPCVKAMARGLDLLRSECGMLTAAALPYPFLAVPLAAVLARHDADDPEVRARLVRWVWCSVFGQSYETAPTRQAARDVQALRDWLADGPLPPSVDEFEFDPTLLRDVTPRQRALYRGVMALLTRRELGVMGGEYAAEDTPIFSVDWLKSHGLAARDRDGILNRAPLARKFGQRLHSGPPSTAFTDLRHVLGAGPFEELMTSLLLPAEPGSPLMRDDFAQFVAWREQALGAEIQRVAGNGQPDLVAIGSMVK